MIELPIPRSVNGDPNARELLRVWAAHGSQHVSIDSEAWSDPAAWGLALVDLARHLAGAYEACGKFKRGAAFSRIITGFSTELEHPTDEPTGGLA